MSASEDAQLVAQIKAGDLKAFEALYHKYKGPIFRTALAITRDQGAAEDVLQDCFLRVYLHIHKVDGSVPLSPWLHRIAVNLSYNWAAKQRLRWIPLEEVMDRLRASSPLSPERTAERVELQQIVQEAINSLDFKQRVVLILFYLQGFSLAEIAYILDCPVGTVKSRLHYGRENLRRKLQRDERLSGELAYEFT
ncbi:MAG TPA: sigma-70 family RNA polymerase sigma factor [Anaerolineae bacterium]|nr:sigma-70 family RNA polymerase sigma factor [Anaerolineae bacterium]